jgi:outer membrane protein TolC
MRHIVFGIVATMMACGWVPHTAAQIPQLGTVTAPAPYGPLPTVKPARSIPPTTESGERIYPITLAIALRLAGVRTLDVQLADQQVAIAVYQLDRAKLLWVPNLVTGLDYFRHEGGQQNFAGDIVRSSRGSLAVGVGPNAVVSLTDAIYAPLAAKQDLKARHAFRQTAENDVSLAIAEAYFTVLQARGELAGALQATQKAEELATKAEKLAEGLAPPLEASRAQVELARRQQAVTTARERWRTASADLVRLLRLEPGTLIDPAEPSFLPITVIDSQYSLDSLIPIALTNRPELAGNQAVVQATLTRWKQEQHRPIIPSIALRSTATNPSGSIAWGGFGGGPNDRMRAFGSRFDLDLQVLWEFQSLGFGNQARVGERRAEHQAAILELFRTQDRIAAEVSTAFAQVKSARERMTQTEPALKAASELVEKSLIGMGQTKRMGDTNVLIVRPQEVVAAVQSFGQANADYFSAIADYNRAQFRLYRALGHPAEQLAGSIRADVRTLPPSILPPVTQAGHSEPQRRPPPKPLESEEPQRLSPIRVDIPLIPRTELLDLPVMRAILYRQPDPTVPDLGVLVSSSEPVKTESNWVPVNPAPSAPKALTEKLLSEPRPVAPLPKPKPVEETVPWEKAKSEKE